MPKKHAKAFHHYVLYAGMGFQMVAIMGIAIWIGMKLDSYVNWGFPVFLSLFSVGSAVLAMYITIRKLLHTIHKQAQPKSPNQHT